MPKNISEIPYTEIQERVLEIGRIPPNSIRKVRGAIQYVYMFDIPSKFDWNFLLVSSGLTTVDQYNAGTVSVNTQGTTVTFSSDVVLTAAMTGRKLRINGNDVIYDFTFSNTTGGTINPPFNGPANASANGYTIFQPTYPLAHNFDRFPEDGGIYKWEGGKKKILPEEPYQEYVGNYSGQPGNPEKVRVVGTDTRGTQLIEFRPAPKDARNYGYDYIKKLTPLTETSSGFVTISAGGTNVTGISSKFTEANTGDYLRINAFGTHQDSEWYKIIAIANDSSLTLATAFANSAVTSAGYVISKAPEYPARVHLAVIYGTLRATALDQNDNNSAVYDVKLAEVLSDSKRIHVTRVYSQDMHGVHEDYMYRR